MTDLAGPLGNTTKYVSPSQRAAGQNYAAPPKGATEAERRAWSRNLKFYRKGVAADLLPDDKAGRRVKACFTRPISREKRIEHWYAEDVQRGHIKNIQVCGSVWLCPVCAAKIAERRREELRRAIYDNKSYQKFMATFTISHARRQRLEDVYRLAVETLRRLMGGKAWLNFKKKYGIEAYIIAHELTVSIKNGWHPHIHILFFGKFQMSESLISEIRSWLSDRWRSILAAAGGYASNERGVDVRAGDTHVGDYVAKFGLDAEMTRGATSKTGRANGHYAPFQLLDLAAQGDAWAAAAWQEYAAVMPGKRQLVWSKNARKLLKLAEVEKTDEELANESEGKESYLLMWYELQQWQAALKLAIIAELLTAGDSGHGYEILRVLELHGIPTYKAQWDYAFNQDVIEELQN